MIALDREGRSELHYAAGEGLAARTQELIAAGADVALADRRRWTPLHFAAQGNHPRIATILLDAGAPVDAKDEHGNTPLWRAVFVSKGEGDLIAVLRAAGADPTRANRHGTSPRALAHVVANYDVARHFADLVDT